MKKLVLYFSLCMLLLTAGWASARTAMSGMEPYLAAAAGAAASAVAAIVALCLHGMLRLVPTAMLTGCILYLLFWKLTDGDLLGTCVVLMAYLSCIAVLLLSGMKKTD